MQIVPLKTVHGEGKAWEILSLQSPEDVCKRSLASYDRVSGLYEIKSFGIDFKVSPSEKRIFSSAPESSLFLETLKDFFRLSVLWYMTSAKDIPFTGRLIRPLDVKGGQRFFAGTHVLPLNDLAGKYGGDREGFLKRGREFGAGVLSHGDASIRLFPLPRVPVTLILWVEDEEFPARVDLLFDSTCDLQISLSDLIWSVAMMSCLVML